MARIGRGADWLGDVDDDQFLTHDAIPRMTRKVGFSAIKTAADAREYARRFFHNAVDSAARSKKQPIKDRWALAAHQYVMAHDLAGQGGSIADVKIGLNSADLNSASAIQADKGKTLGPATPWSPPAQDSPPEAASLPATAPAASTEASPAPQAPEAEEAPAPPASSPRPTPRPTLPPPVLPDSSPASSGGDVPAPAELAPPTIPSEWLIASLLPAATSKIKLEAVKTLAQATQYARRFFEGAVTHGRKATGALQQRWAEAARIYVYSARLAGDPFIDGALEAVQNDLRAADILSAQAIAAEKGGQLAPLTVEWFTSPLLAQHGLATFKLTGSLKLPSSATSSSSSGSSSTSSSSGAGAEPASLDTSTAGRLPRTFDAIINRFRGPIPLAFIRALIMAESSFNPNDENATSTARGLLQITPTVLDSWNKAHPQDSTTEAQLFDPTINLKLGIDLIRRIVDGYNRNHPSMRMNFLSARYVEVLAEAWNVGHSEATGVGFILSAFERDGTESTLTNVVTKGPLVAGLKETVGTRIKDRGTQFPVRVRQLYFGELSRGESFGPQLATAGLGEDAAFVFFMGALLLGDEVFG